MRAFLFPGQGSQSVGMGSGLAEASRAARDTFDEVDEALGQHLFRLMREGPAEELTLTENAQPAIMAHSIAVLRALGVQLGDVADFVAGHSLGEYSALCAAGSFDLGTTAKLLKLRGKAMQAAVPVGEGAMAALLGADLALARRQLFDGVTLVVGVPHIAGHHVLGYRRAEIEIAARTGPHGQFEFGGVRPF